MQPGLGPLHQVLGSPEHGNPYFFQKLNLFEAFEDPVIYIHGMKCGPGLIYLG